MCPHIKESELSVVMIIAGHLSYLADHNYLINQVTPAGCFLDLSRFNIFTYK